MICKNCSTFYVRDPCPNCGYNSLRRSEKDTESEKGLNESVKPSQIRERESKSGSQLLMQKDDDQLVKPSQRFKEEQENDEDLPSFARFNREQQNKQSSLPQSKVNQEREKDRSPSKTKQTDEDKLIKPSDRIRQDIGEDEIPSFQRYQRDSEVDVSNLSKLNRPDQKEKLKNDAEYRSKVKETLEEVMGLLEKLIDDE